MQHPSATNKGQKQTKTTTTNVSSTSKTNTTKANSNKTSTGTQNTKQNTAQSKTSTQNTKQNVPQTKKVEEQKSQSAQQVVQKQEPQLKAFSTINLPKMLDEIDKIKKLKKTTIILDPTEAAFTFFKYKGETIDLQTHSILEQTGKQDRAKSIESTRGRLAVGLKSGTFVPIFLGQTAKNMTEFYKTAEFWQQDKLFNPDAICQEAFFKKYILKPEEDVDYQGNKGFFSANSDFTLIILISGNYDDYGKLYQELGVDPKYFEIVKIEEKQQQQQQQETD